MTDKKEKKEEKNAYYVGLGRRKSAIAKVKLERGEGKLEINKKPLEDYFTILAHRITLRKPLEVAELKDQVDISVDTHGGGMRAQADAARLGISRAILKFDKEKRGVLKAAGFLTRDPREKERMKPGLKGARRAPQFSKR